MCDSVEYCAPLAAVLAPIALVDEKNMEHTGLNDDGTVNPSTCNLWLRQLYEDVLSCSMYVELRCLPDSLTNDDGNFVLNRLWKNEGVVAI